MTRHLLIPACLLIGVLAFSACTPAPAPSNPVIPVLPVNSGGPPGFNWDKNPNSIILRLDRQLQGDTRVSAMNRLPLCTLYGNGHLVWTNEAPPDGEQVLEAQLDDTAIRVFLDLAIRQQHFFSVPDYAAGQLAPAGEYIVESMALNLKDAVRTVRSYGHWPNNEFQMLLDKCTHLTSQPALYAPTGAWLSVFLADQSDSGSGAPIQWQSNQPFKLSDVAASGKPIWISGSLLGTLWTIQRQTLGAVQWLENGKSYQIGLQVPDISRDSPAPPQVTPTPAPLIIAPTPTLIPTVTTSGITSLSAATAPPTPLGTLVDKAAQSR